MSILAFEKHNWFLNKIRFLSLLGFEFSSNVYNFALKLDHGGYLNNPQFEGLDRRGNKIPRKTKLVLFLVSEHILYKRKKKKHLST